MLGLVTVGVGVEERVQVGWERWIGTQGGFAGRGRFGACGQAMRCSAISASREALAEAAWVRL